MIKLSVITINYNNAAGLEKTIRSVSPQLTAEVEFIVIDGGSTDQSAEVIRQHAPAITAWISEKDRGIYHAQNKGLEKAAGEYCLFLNSGDILATNATLGTILKHLGGEDILYGDIFTLDAEGGKTYRHSNPKPDVHHFMVSTLWHPSAFIRRNLFLNFGLYREELRITGDYEFFIRAILKHGCSTRHIALPIAVFDMGGISNTAGLSDLQAQERKRSWELNFSGTIIAAFEDYTRLQRSREYKLSKFIKAVLNPFSRKS